MANHPNRGGQMRTYVMMLSGNAAVTVTRDYAMRASAERYAKAHGLVISDSYPTGEAPPATSDARAWDAYRTRHGYAGG